jgi:glutathione S-transferase/3-isopropylmalate dehydratase
MAGETFTAADISVGYALEMARKNAGVALGELEQAYMARLRRREAYRRALAVCHATRTWWAS